jgi:hypothetical protein
MHLSRSVKTLSWEGKIDFLNSQITITEVNIPPKKVSISIWEVYTMMQTGIATYLQSEN